MKKFINAFTLIELLIVIVIIGMLAVAIIPRIKGMQDKARYIRVEKDFRDFRTIVYQAQTISKKTLPQILTPDTCTACNCGWIASSGRFGTTYFPGLTENSVCRAAWVNVLRKIEVAADMMSGSLSFMEKDPRGSPYLFDSNDREHWYAADPCNPYGVGTNDLIASVGADGRGESLNIANFALITGDDRYLSIPSLSCPGAY